MRIQIKSGETRIHIPIPTGLIFSKPSVWLYLKLGRRFFHGTEKYIPENRGTSVDSYWMNLPEEAMYALCDEILRIKRQYGSWDLVEVTSASGDEVLIRL